VIRPEAKASLWRWRELVIGILVVVIGANWFFTSFGLLKSAGAVAMVFGAIAIFVGQQRGRFRISGSAPGIISLVEGQITYFGPHDGGTIATADITGVSLVTHADMRSWRLDQNGQASLIIPITASGGDLLFDAFAELKGLNLENMVRQISQESNHSVVIWRRTDYELNDQYLH
jgi:hypothetical protein